MPPSARVVTLTECSCTEYYKVNDLAEEYEHAIIEWHDIALTPSAKAAAVSYPWGDHDPTAFPIGHTLKNHVAVSFALGEEWDKPAFLKTLMEQSKRFSSIWIDQLCNLRVDEEQARYVYQTIPTIFRMLGVLIFHPGTRCRCLEDWIDKNENRPTLEDLGDCLNSLGLCSYFDRIWTRQEFRYARYLEVIPVKTPSLCCVKISDIMAEAESYYSVNPFLLCWLQRSDLDIYQNWKAVDTLVEQLFQRFLLRFEESFLNKFYGDLIEMDENLMMARFWTGRLVLKAESYVNDSIASLPALLIHEPLDPSAQLAQMTKFEDIRAYFCRSSALSNSSDSEQHELVQRFREFYADLDVVFLSQFFSIRAKVKATQQRDYIISMWADLPSYKIPRGFMDMSLAQLYSNALDQHERSLGHRIVTYAPAGLFQNSQSPSTILRPADFLEDSDIYSSDDIYGTIAQTPSSLAFDWNGALRFKLNHRNANSLLHISVPLREYIESSSSSPHKSISTLLTFWPFSFRYTAYNRAKDMFASFDTLLPSLIGKKVDERDFNSMAGNQAALGLAVRWMLYNVTENCPEVREPVELRLGTRRRYLLRSLDQTHRSDKPLNPLRNIDDFVHPANLHFLKGANPYTLALYCVALGLGIPPHACLRLQLLVSRTDPPFIGLFRENLRMEPPPNSETLDVCRPDRKEENCEQMPLYEALPCCIEDCNNKYEVCGVWLPTTRSQSFATAKYNFQDYDFLVV